MNFAIIGASGNVGRKTIEILEKSKIPFEELYLVASKKSAGKKIKFRKKEIEIENLENYDFSKASILIFFFLKVIIFPALFFEATKKRLSILILDFSKISMVLRPTLPVAPTIAKFIKLLF